jgi:L-fuconolactonase
VPRVDAHQHFWRYDPLEYGWIEDRMAALRRDFLPRDLEPMMRRAGVDACVAVQARQSLDDTRWLLSLADAHPFIAGVVGWVGPAIRGCGARSRGARASSETGRHPPHRASEPDDRFLLRPAFLRGLERLEEFGLAYDVLIYSRHLPVAAELAERLPRQRFVLDHLAKPDIRGRERERGARDLRAWRRSRTCGEAVGLSRKRMDGWTSEDMHPYSSRVRVFRSGAADDRIRTGRLHRGGDYERTMAVVLDYLAAVVAQRDAVLGGNAIVSGPAGAVPMRETSRLTDRRHEAFQFFVSSDFAALKAAP